MGQAAVDLPDILSQPPTPLSGADDLLSQMAGAQIEQMLADTESSRPPATTDAAPAVDPFASQLDDIFNQLNAATAENKSVEQPAVEPAPIVGAAPVIEAPIEQATTSAERDALTPVVDVLSEALNAPALPETPSEPRASIFLRILELINAPFAACPDILRDMLGKVAILTAMNSLGVLLYVMLFRKH
jgi:hypothetical protein